MAAIERQRLRFRSAMVGSVAAPAPKPAAIRQTRVTPFPKAPLRFFAPDVETANHDCGSICEIGVACVRPDSSIKTWVTYVDPQVDRWVFTYLHGLSARTVQGAPTFAEVLPLLRDALNGATVYQPRFRIPSPAGLLRYAMQCCTQRTRSPLCRTPKPNA